MSSSHARPSPTADDYARAERALTWNRKHLVSNADIEPRWIGNKDRFWYLRTNLAGQKEFVVVEARTGERAPAFDHQGLAAALSRKLLLLHGELDDNVHPALTMKLVDALIKANKDFELLIRKHIGSGESCP